MILKAVRALQTRVTIVLKYLNEHDRMKFFFCMWDAASLISIDLLREVQALVSRLPVMNDRGFQTDFHAVCYFLVAHIIAGTS